jgi:hypothetical protein
LKTSENIILGANTIDESVGFDFDVGDLIELVSLNLPGIVISRGDDEIIRVRCDPELYDMFMHTKVKKAVFNVLVSTGEIIEEYGEYIRRI